MDKQHLLKLFGSNVKRFRNECNFSQFELAEKLKLARITVAQMEAGKYFVTAETLANLSSVFNCEVFEFFKEKN